jgi:uncharacterized protein YndB with AHSA1/START domain
MTNKMVVTAEPGKQELFFTREFDAPRELVYKAFTDRKLYEQWMGPNNRSARIEKFASEAGQPWREVYSSPDGKEFACSGVCHYVSEPEKLIRTFEFEGLPERGHVSLETATFEELPGNRTRMNAQSVFQSVADRDGMIQSGMERGAEECFQRLDSLLAKQDSATANA